MVKALREAVSVRLCESVCVRERLSVLIKAQTDAVERSKNSQKGLKTAGYTPPVCLSLSHTPPVGLCK